MCPALTTSRLSGTETFTSDQGHQIAIDTRRGMALIRKADGTTNRATDGVFGFRTAGGTHVCLHTGSGVAVHVTGADNGFQAFKALRREVTA